MHKDLVPQFYLLKRYGKTVAVCEGTKQDAERKANRLKFAYQKITGRWADIEIVAMGDCITFHATNNTKG